MRIIPKFDTELDRFDRTTVFGYFPYDIIFQEVTPGPFRVANLQTFFPVTVMKSLSRIPAGENSTMEFLARVSNWANVPIIPVDLLSATYRVYLLENATREEIDVPGHVDVEVTPADCLFELREDAKWKRDNVGYNFHHIPSLDDAPIFVERNEIYVVEYTLVPANVAYEPILVSFRVETY